MSSLKPFASLKRRFYNLTGNIEITFVSIVKHLVRRSCQTAQKQFLSFKLDKVKGLRKETFLTPSAEIGALFDGKFFESGEKLFSLIFCSITT